MWFLFLALGFFIGILTITLIDSPIKYKEEDYGPQ